MQADTKRKILEQGRAEFAYKCVKQVLDWKSFIFGTKPIDRGKIIKCWFYKKFEGKYGNNPIYRGFIENPEKKFYEFSNHLKRIGNKNKYTPEDKLKESIVESYNAYKSEYKSFAKKIPMLIRNNGIAATFAFVNARAKDGNAYELLYSHTDEWLKNCSIIDLSCEDDLVKELVSMKSTDYRAVTIEVLAFFNWLRRFAEGLIKGEDENEGEDEGDGIDE
ncbi:MAG: type III-B CRISPR module-associated protein Cmr5 [Acetivibrionales bacterium]